MEGRTFNETLGHDGHFHRSNTGRLQIAARPRGGQTADEEGRRHGGERGALLLSRLTVEMIFKKGVAVKGMTIAQDKHRALRRSASRSIFLPRKFNPLVSLSRPQK